MCAIFWTFDLNEYFITSFGGSTCTAYILFMQKITVASKIRKAAWNYEKIYKFKLSKVLFNIWRMLLHNSYSYWIFNLSQHSDKYVKFQCWIFYFDLMKIDVATTYFHSKIHSDTCVRSMYSLEGLVVTTKFKKYFDPCWNVTPAEKVFTIYIFGYRFFFLSFQM